MACNERRIPSSLRMIATKALTETAIQVCDLTAISDVPKKRFETEVFVGVERPSVGDQPLSQVRMHLPGAAIVGASQRRDTDRSGKAGIVHLRRNRLRLAGKARNLLRPVNWAQAIVTGNSPRECLPGKELHDLREEGLATVHTQSMQAIGWRSVVCLESFDRKLAVVEPI